MVNGVVSVSGRAVVFVIVTDAAPIEPVVTDPKSTDGGVDRQHAGDRLTVNAAEPVQPPVAVATMVKLERAGEGRRSGDDAVAAQGAAAAAAPPVRMVNVYGAVPPLAVSVCE